MTVSAAKKSTNVTKAITTLKNLLSNTVNRPTVNRHSLNLMIYYLIDGVIYYVERKTEQTVHAGIQEAGRGDHDERKAKLPRNSETI